VATLSTETETRLVSQAQQGDRSAFGELIHRHYSGVVNVVYRLCGDVHLAEDAAQDAFIQAWLHLPTYHPQTPLRNWLYRIAVNAALDALRRGSKTVTQDVDDLGLVSANPGPEAVLIREERAVSVQRALLSLPPASRVVVVLREYEGLSYQEIATALDIPIGTVMSRLNYARSRLRVLLEPQWLQMEITHD
jgi:RNA polymerase sigma-70 factor, ECF subfamily